MHGPIRSFSLYFAVYNFFISTQPLPAGWFEKNGRTLTMEWETKFFKRYIDTEEMEVIARFSCC